MGGIEAEFRNQMLVGKLSTRSIRFTFSRFACVLCIPLHFFDPWRGRAEARVREAAADLPREAVLGAHHAGALVRRRVAERFGARERPLQEASSIGSLKN